MDPVSSFMVATVKDIDAEVSVKLAAKMLSDFGIGSLLVKRTLNMLECYLNRKLLESWLL